MSRLSQETAVEVSLACTKARTEVSRSPDSPVVINPRETL